MTQLLRGWFHLASGAGVGRIGGFVSNLLLSRWLGPTELGLFNLVATTVQTSDTLVRCGGDYALNFELGAQPEAIHSARGTQLARALVQLCSLTTLLICIGIAVWVWWGEALFPGSLPTSNRLFLTILLLLMIACEGISSSAWEVLLVSHRTVPLSLRQGLFIPLRIFCAAVGALFGGVLGAMAGWSLTALVQCIWLKTVLMHLWSPTQILPFWGESISALLKRGFPFYVSNLFASMIFYPLLLKVSAERGITEIGYLRVGQILQQVFAFLPATLVPVLFLKLRAQSTFSAQASLIEKPFKLIWVLLLELLLLYCIFDHILIKLLFGSSFSAALMPTRLLLITALFECLSQLVVQPLLAAAKIRAYSFWQNGSAVLAAVLGWIWIPSAGLAAYLIVRLIYVLLPLAGFAIPVFLKFNEPKKLLPLTMVSFGMLLLILIEILGNHPFEWMPAIVIAIFISMTYLNREDLFQISQVLIRS